MNITIVDYGSGNLHSVAKSFEHVAQDLDNVSDISVTSDPESVRRADSIVLPGVGAYADCLAGLTALPGMRQALDEAVRNRAVPFLGVCVGMQLMAQRGLEHGSTEGFGWVSGEVRKIEPADPALKIPHMGWNTLTLENPHPLMEDIPTGLDGWHAYFVHSYALAGGKASENIASADYGGPVTAMVAHDNLAGTQFHPEKSQKLGLKLIANFLSWRP